MCTQKRRKKTFCVRLFICIANSDLFRGFPTACVLDLCIVFVLFGIIHSIFIVFECLGKICARYGAKSLKNVTRNKGLRFLCKDTLTTDLRCGLAILQEITTNSVKLMNLAVNQLFLIQKTFVIQQIGTQCSYWNQK